MSSKYYNNYNIWTEPRFLNRTEPNSFRVNYEYFSKKPNRNKKFISDIPSKYNVMIRQLQCVTGAPEVLYST